MSDPFSSMQTLLTLQVHCIGAEPAANLCLLSPPCQLVQPVHFHSGLPVGGIPPTTCTFPHLPILIRSTKTLPRHANLAVTSNCTLVHEPLQLLTIPLHRTAPPHFGSFSSLEELVRVGICQKRGFCKLSLCHASGQQAGPINVLHFQSPQAVTTSNQGPNKASLQLKANWTIHTTATTHTHAILYPHHCFYSTQLLLSKFQ